MRKKHLHRYDHSRRRAKGKGRDHWDDPLGERAQRLYVEMRGDFSRAIGRDGAEARTRSVADTIRRQRDIVGVSDEIRAVSTMTTAATLRALLPAGEVSR